MPRLDLFGPRKSVHLFMPGYHTDSIVRKTLQKLLSRSGSAAFWLTGVQLTITTKLSSSVWPKNESFEFLFLVCMFQFDLVCYNIYNIIEEYYFEQIVIMQINA